MSKNNFEILTEVYSGTSIGERIKKREQVISDYLNVYGQLILNKVLKPTPVMEHLAKKYNFSRCGVLKILKEAGIYNKERAEAALFRAKQRLSLAKSKK